MFCFFFLVVFFFQAEDGIRDRSPSRGLGDVYKRQDLVEAEIFYTALFDTPKTRIFNRTVFHDMPNILTEILPDCKEYEDIVKVCHTEGMHLKLYSDIQNSETVLGFES